MLMLVGKASLLEVLNMLDKHYNIPERGKSTPCERCGVAAANQHTIRQSAICDGIKNGKIEKTEGQRLVKASK